MKRKIGIVIMIIMIAGIVCYLIHGRADTAKVKPAVYQELLAEYERALEDPTYTWRQWGNDVYDMMTFIIGKYPVCYCIKDLNDDGREELIIGGVRNGEPFERFGTVYDDPCEIYIIYTYKDEDVKWSVTQTGTTILYEGGSVEFIVTVSFMEYYMYYQAGEEYKKLDTLAVKQQEGEAPHYYKFIHEGDGRAISCEEVTEEEFHEIRNRYATAAEELDWKPLEGFWEPEAVLSLYDLEQVLKGNIFGVIRKFMK